MQKKDDGIGFGGLACFIALLLATVLFVIEYVLQMSNLSWSNYLLIAKDIAIALGVFFGSMAYVRNKGFLIKFLFAVAILVYIVFAILTVVYA